MNVHNYEELKIARLNSLGKVHLRVKGENAQRRSHALVPHKLRFCGGFQARQGLLAWRKAIHADDKNR